MSLDFALLMLPGLLIGLTVHEFAHAWSASLLGDDFARRQGRVSLNPLRHLSPLGTLAIFLLPFGWGRPVPVNLYNFRRPRRDYLLTSLAGPLSNLFLVAFCLSLMQFTRHTFLFGAAGEYGMVLAHVVLTMMVIINTMLAVLNLLPLPPLDGSKIWPCLIPVVKPAGGARTARLSLIVLVVLISTDSLQPITTFALNSVMRLTPPADKAALVQKQADAAKALTGNRWAEAESLFGEALAVYPESHESLYGRAVARGCQENWLGAMEDITGAIDLHPDPAYYTLRAGVFRRLGRDNDARADEATADALQQAQESVQR